MLDTKPILLAGLLTAAASTASAAETCRDLVDRLAEQHALHAAPPAAVRPAAPDASELPGAVTPEELARSGGVIEPPPTGDDEAIVEPPPTGDPMPTTPPVGEGPAAAGEPAHQRQTQVEALLAAARAAADQGDEQLCRDRLEEAQNLIAGVRGG